MADWIERPIHQAIYSLERQIAQVTWGADRSGLLVVDLIDRLRLNLVTQGFTAALDTIAVSIVGLSRPVFELALALACVLVLIAPISPLRWINVRKTLLLVVVIPIFFPLLAASFQDIDAARGDLATTIYNEVFSRVDFNMAIGDSGGNGTPEDMPPIEPYSPRTDGRQGIRGVDVAAAYLWADRGDVLSLRDLPLDFEERYFPNTIAQFGDLNGPERWAAIEHAGNGITRTLYGGILILFAFFETLTNLCLTIALGFLLVTVMLASIFAFFAPFEGFVAQALRKMAELFLQSWAISALQALSLAAVVDVAESGNGAAVLGMGGVGLVLQLLYTGLAFQAMWGVVSGLGVGGGGMSTQQIMRPLMGAAGAALGPMGTVAAGAAKTAAAFGVAKAAGASTAYAGGFAASSTGLGRQVGSLATAMGRVAPDGPLHAGMYAGTVVGRGAPTSMAGITRMRQDLAPQRPRPPRPVESAPAAPLLSTPMPSASAPRTDGRPQPARGVADDAPLLSRQGVHPTPVLGGFDALPPLMPVPQVAPGLAPEALVSEPMLPPDAPEPVPRADDPAPLPPRSSRPVVQRPRRITPPMHRSRGGP